MLTLDLEFEAPGASPAIHFQGPGPDRTVSSSTKRYPVTIVDNDFRVMGAATISGAPQVGQTLTAVTTGIRDPDGLTTANYMYQWIGVDGGTEADISSANSSTYTLLAADLGKTIKVRVTFTDDASNAETRTSVATATVIAAPPSTCGVPDFGSRRNIWTGALTVEAYSVSGVLVAHGFDSIVSVGALAPTTFHIGLNGYTVDGVGVPAGGTFDGDLQFGLTSDLTAAEVAALRLHVCDTTYDFSAANHVASNSTYTWADDLDWSGETTLTLYLSLPAELPAITIAADRPTATGKMDWIHYTLNREGDTAAELTVTVILAGPAGNDWSLDTTKTSQEVTFAADSATATHIIRVIGSGFGHIGFSESATMGGTLTARLGAKTGYDTSDTDEVVVVVTSGPAWVIKLTEDAYSFDEDGGDQDIELVATAASADMPAPSLHPTNNSSALAVALITEAGTAHSPGDYAALTTSRLFPSSTCNADPDADNVQVCRLNVTFTPVDDGEEEPDETLKLALSEAPGASPAIHFQGPGPDRTVSSSTKRYPVTIVDNDFRVMGAATISGAPQVGQTLTAVTTGIRDPDGLTTANYMYQWIGVDGGTEADISSANSSTYTLLAADLGKTIKVRVTFTDDASNAETRTSVATATVIAASPSTCGVPDFGSRSKIWTGALTVEAYSVSGVLVAHGFDSIVSVGALAPTTFHIGLNGYTVDGVGVPAGGTFDGDLQFGLTSDLTAAEVAALRLHVCDTAYDFSAANHVASNSTYTWADDLDWSGETTLTLYLSLPPAITIAADRPTATGKMDWIHYTLNREGDTAAELTVTVILAGPAGNDWGLDPTGSAKREVTFAADSATATRSSE